MLDAAETLRDRLLLGLLYGCGLKPGEACGLKWRDLDPEQKTVRVIHAPTRQNRTLRLPDELVPILSQ